MGKSRQKCSDWKEFGQENSLLLQNTTDNLCFRVGLLEKVKEEKVKNDCRREEDCRFSPYTENSARYVLRSNHLMNS